jgi:hypothetical protein
MARCGGCGATLEVGVRQLRRIKNTTGAALCRTCRGGRSIEARDSDYRFWLSKYGVEVPRGVPALEAVAASGSLPPELAALAQGFVAGDWP